jgi:hypothetical protein
MASTPSGLGAGSGAVACRRRCRRARKPSSCALCSATSSTRATTCVVPAALVVGVSTIVRRRGRAAVAQDLVAPPPRAARGRPRARARRVSAGRGSRVRHTAPPWPASARAGPEPSEKNFLPPVSSLLAARLQPAYWLARQASTGCELRTSQPGRPAVGGCRCATAPRRSRRGRSRRSAGPPRSLPGDAMPASTMQHAAGVGADGHAHAVGLGDEPLDPRRDMAVQAQRGDVMNRSPRSMVFAHDAGLEQGPHRVQFLFQSDVQAGRIIGPGADAAHRLAGRKAAAWCRQVVPLRVGGQGTGRRQRQAAVV